MKLLPGKFNVSIGGQWGSEGKALLNQYLSLMNTIDISINNCAPNAGHSFIKDGRKYISKYIPVSSIFNKRNTIYLCSNAIVHPATLLEEIEFFEIDYDRVSIHPNCAIIEDEDILFERDEHHSVFKIASTQKGGGSALSRKILRSATLAKDIPSLKRFINEIDLHYYLDNNCIILMEVPQGFELSLNSKHYPYVTSRDIDISSAMASAQVHPSYLGVVCVVIRTLPIRVGHILDSNNNILGNSGPVYSDMVELNWSDLGITPEITTVTKRTRRIFSFSLTQYMEMKKQLKPDYILLNFANYLNSEQLNNLLESLEGVTHLGFGETPDKIYLNNLI